MQDKADEKHISIENQMEHIQIKSRPKRTGGTGLGLSIVKHIEGYNKLKVEMQSTEGQATDIMYFIKK